MQARLQDFYEYLFTDKANIELGIRADLKQEYKDAQLSKRRSHVVALFDELKKQNSDQFRAALRELKNVNKGYLETILYGNSTDVLEQKYAFPEDDHIDKQFEAFENKHHLFLEKDFKNKQAEFRIYFKICKLIGDLVEHTNSINDHTAYQQAYAMIVIFGDQKPPKYFQAFVDYVKDQNYANEKYALYDILMHELPRNILSRTINLTEWRKMILQSGIKALQLFRRAPEITQDLEGKTPTNYIEARKIARTLEYKRSNEFPELAELCLHYHIPEIDFNYALQIHKQSKKTDKLPTIFVDGNEVGHPGYYLVKLPANDLRGYLLGEITNCCQSIGGNGEHCVIDGMTREDNGFLVMIKTRKKTPVGAKDSKDHEVKSSADIQEILKNGKIRGQGYLWRSDFGNLVVDSWENLDQKNEDDVAVKLLKLYAKKIVEQKESDILRMTIGTGGKTPADLFEKMVICPETMLQGEQYEDSFTQKIIYTNTLHCQKLSLNIKKKLQGLLTKVEPEIIDQLLGDHDLYSNSQAEAISLLLEDPEFQQYLIQPEKQAQLVTVTCKGPLIWNVLAHLSKARLCSNIDMDPLNDEPHLVCSNIDFIVRKVGDWEASPFIEKIISILSKSHTLNEQTFPEILRFQNPKIIGKLADLLDKLQSKNLLNLSLIKFIIYGLSPEVMSSFGDAIVRLHNNKLLTPKILFQMQQDPARANIYADHAIATAQGISDINLGQLLCNLAARGDLDHIKNIFTRIKIQDINYLKYHRDTPLMLASENNRMPVLNFLIEKKTDVNAVDSTGRTALLIAVQNHHNRVIKKLLEHKEINVNIADDEGYTPLLAALTHEDPELREYLAYMILEHPEVLINKHSKLGYTPLYYACWQGDYDIVKTLLERNAQINTAVFGEDAKPFPGATPLHVAILRADLNVIALLFKYKVNINAKMSNGFTPLHLATELDSELIIQLLLQNKNLNINEQNQEGNTALHLAFKSYNKCLSLLLNDDKININIPNNLGETPIFTAIREKHFTAIRTLLKKEPKLNLINKHGSNLLHVAIESIHIKDDLWLERTCGNYFKELFESKTTLSNDVINGKNKDGLTPLDLAFKNRQFFAAYFLLKNDANFYATSIEELTNSLFEIIKRCEKNDDLTDAEQIRLEYEMEYVFSALLQRFPKLPTDTKDTEYTSPIHLAAAVGNKKIIELLLEKKADIHIKDNLGNNLIHTAATSNKGGDSIDLLLKLGIPIDEKNQAGDTALSIAVKNKDMGAINQLITNGANVNTANAEGDTPLLLAAQSIYLDSYNIVNLLLRAKGNLNAKNSSGETALFLAAKNAPANVFITLLEAKSEVTQTNLIGDTLLHVVAKSKKPICAEKLIDLYHSSLNPNAINSLGSTALHLAVKSLDNKMVSTLGKMKDINFDIKDADGLTALDIAIRNRDLLTTQVLASHVKDMKSLQHAFDTTPSDVIQACLLFKKPISADEFKTFQNHLDTISHHASEIKSVDNLYLIEINAILKTDLPLPVQHLKIVKLLQSILENAFDNIFSRDRFFSSAKLNQQEFQFYKLIHDILQDVEKNCRWSLELPTHQFKQLEADEKQRFGFSTRGGKEQ